MTTSVPISDIQNINVIKDLYNRKGLIRDLLLFTLAINTGMALNDLLNLKVGDVKNKEYLLLDKNKSVPLNDELKTLILQFTADKKNNELLFQSKNGGKLDRWSVLNTFKNICKELGLPDCISVASWRKTFAYHHYQKYKDLSYLQWLFNQTTVNLTLKFIGVQENMNLRCREGVVL